LGLASGDAMGMPTEFLTPEQITEYYGEVNSFVQPHPKQIHAGMPAGRVTDDTGQALALANAAVAAGGRLTAAAAAEALLDWADLLGPEYMHVAGPSTRRALALLKRGFSLDQAGWEGKTNGAAMRAPIAGLLHPGNLDAAVQTAYDASLPTHGTNVAIAGSCAVACAVAQALVPNSSLDSIMLAAMDGAARGANRGRTVWGSSLKKRIQLARRLVEQAENEKAAMQALYDYVGVDLLVSESVATAFGVVQLAQGDPIKAILVSANLGGDTDTIGAISGAVCGTLKGARVFPPDWIETLERVNHLGLVLTSEKLSEIISD